MAYMNLRPEYTDHISRSSFSNFEKLQKLCKVDEQRRTRAKSYRPPPRPESSCYPTLAYQGNVARQIKPRLAPIESVETDSPDASDGAAEGLLAALQNPAATKLKLRNRQNTETAALVKQIKELQDCLQKLLERPNIQRNCWNCGKFDHFSKECPEPKKEIECYKCKTPRFISTNCPNCKKSEN